MMPRKMHSHHLRKSIHVQTVLHAFHPLEPSQWQWPIAQAKDLTRQIEAQSGLPVRRIRTFLVRRQRRWNLGHKPEGFQDAQNAATVPLLQRVLRIFDEGR